MRAVSSLVCLIGLCVGAPAGAAQEAPPDTAWYEPGYDVGEEGTELVVVYFGGSTCGWCYTEEARGAVRGAVLALQERARREGKAFAYVGVANDWDIEAGLGFLEASGPFDEIVVGRNWNNHASADHLFMNPDATPALPTVVVYEQDISAGARGPVFGGERYLAAVSGGPALAEWVAAGAPLPHVAPALGAEAP